VAALFPRLKSQPDLSMFALDRHSPIALGDQIELRLRELIAARQLPPGARLLSIRQLALSLAVSPNTVVGAYDRLVASGLIDARGTAGYFVSEPRSGPAQLPDAAALEAGEEQEGVWLAQQANDQRSGVLLASSTPLRWSLACWASQTPSCSSPASSAAASGS